MLFCVRAQAMHHPELLQTTHTRGSTSAFVPILATGQTWREVKGGVQEQGREGFTLWNAASSQQCNSQCRRKGQFKYSNGGSTLKLLLKMHENRVHSFKELQAMSKALVQQLSTTHIYLLFIETLCVLLTISPINSTWSTNSMYCFRKIYYLKTN